MTNKYAELQESYIVKISTEVIGILSKFIHNVQLERGLSSGYITYKTDSSHKALLQQRERTDAAYQDLLCKLK